MSMVLICISLMTNDVEHLFMCLFAICIFSSGEVFAHDFCQFLTQIICTFSVEFCESFGLDTNPL